MQGPIRRLKKVNLKKYLLTFNSHGNDRAIRQTVKERGSLENTATEMLYVDRPLEGNRVLLKVVQELLHYGNRMLHTYAILDYVSERIMLLLAGVKELGLHGTPEGLPLSTIRQGVQIAVHCLLVSPRKPDFTLRGPLLCLTDHSYPMDRPQRRCSISLV